MGPHSLLPTSSTHTNPFHQSAIVLGLYLPSFVLPVYSSYNFYYAPLNFIFSYLWLTAFVFSAQDYNESQCELNAPFGGSCNLKLTSEAFIFLAL